MFAIGGVGVLSAFVAGLLSFLSPCVLPLVPGYLGYLAGTTSSAAQAGGRRWYIAGHALCFVLGFTIIFVLLGAGASALGQVLLRHSALLQQLAGVLVICFGLTMALAQVVRWPWLFWLYRERRAEVRMSSVTLARSILVGLAFGAGWTPCIGPVLGSIMTLAAVNDTVGQGMLLLAIYALGLGLPFLLAGVLIDRAGGVLRRLRRYTGLISVGGGLLLVAMGILMLNGTLASLAQYAPILGE